MIQWNCGEVLQGADAVSGPWSDIIGAVSPYFVAGDQVKRFYRVRN